MEMKEQTIDSRQIFLGRIVKLRVDTVRLPGGGTAARECVDHPGAVAVLAVDEKHRVCMVRQFRYPVGEILREIPAGKLDPGEDPLACARRELEEETGYRAREWRKLYTYFSTPGFTNEIMHLYLATGLEKGDSRPDEDEVLEMEMVRLDDCLALLNAGGIKDSKTIIALLYLAGLGPAE